MSRRRGISLIIGFLILACLAQATVAAPDGTGNESAGQPVITPTPVVTNEMEVVGNTTGEAPGTGVMPIPAATPDPSRRSVAAPSHWSAKRPAAQAAAGEESRATQTASIER